jgi:N-dimethylarginine dimethylaminohydrolase
MSRPLFLMTEPDHFDVSYQINPWMDPGAWRSDAEALKARARIASRQLSAAIEELGAEVRMIKAEAACPDLVFPANAAVVLDAKVLLANFRHFERRAEQPHFKAAFAALRAQGLVDEIVELPDWVAQEGAGDAIWDAGRGHFWVGYGPRSSAASVAAIERTFGRPTVALRLASERFYHLDTCFCPLAGGEVIYFPPAFTPAALETLEAHVDPADRIVATPDEAAAFCVNAVNLDRRIIMAKAPDSLRRKLNDRGYTVTEIDLAPFIMSGGAAYCMTLRLDRRSEAAAREETPATRAA